MDKNNNIINKITIIAVIAFLILGTITIVSLVGSSDKNDELISVSGKSEISVSPDTSEIYLTIKTINIDSKVAKDENSKIVGRVHDALNGIGITDEDIKMISFRIDEYYNYRQINLKTGDDKKPKEFQAVYRFKVTTKDFEKIGTIVDTSVNSGVNEIDRVEYTLSDELMSKVKAEALQKATVVAKEKAQDLADGLGVSVGDVFSITENNYYYEPYRFSANMKAMSSFDGAGSSLNEGLSTDFFNSEDIEVRSEVSVQFKIK